MPKDPIFLEKRAEPRIPIRIPVKFMVLNDPNEINGVIEIERQNRSAFIMDLSMKGMSIVSQQTLIERKILCIDLSLNNYETFIRVFAQVVWTDETGGGLKFLSLKEEDTQFLRDYLNKSAS